MLREPPHLSAIARSFAAHPGVRTAIASLVIAGCAQDQIAAPTVPEVLPVEGRVESPAALNTPDALQLLPLHTYDGSGESVHPDYVAPPAAWFPRLRYLVVTPYPGGNSSFENPSLYAGVDGVTWGAVRGAPLPLVAPQQGYLSDPDISFDPATNELVVYYRQVHRGDHLFMVRSRDAVTWSQPRPVLSGRFASLLSPAIVRRGPGDWMMWTVNAAPWGCYGRSATIDVRYSMNGMDWTEPERVRLRLGRRHFAWHIDVQWISELNEYWALFPVKTAGSCATKAVYLATSPDGETWKLLPKPVLTAGAIPEFHDVVYRSTFAYDPSTDQVTFWFSGAQAHDRRFTWRLAVQRRSRVDLFSAEAVLLPKEIPVAAHSVRSYFDPP